MSTDPDARREFGPYLEGVGPTYKDANGVLQSIRYNSVEDFEAALNIHGENVAAFLVEPIQGEAGYEITFTQYTSS
jgi:ornithine--oxo-acid transaminase